MGGRRRGRPPTSGGGCACSPRGRRPRSREGPRQGSSSAPGPKSSRRGRARRPSACTSTLRPPGRRRRCCSAPPRGRTATASSWSATCCCRRSSSRRLRLVGPQQLGGLGQYLPAAYLHGTTAAGDHELAAARVHDDRRHAAGGGGGLRRRRAMAARPPVAGGRVHAARTPAAPLVVEASVGHAPLSRVCGRGAGRRRAGGATASACRWRSAVEREPCARGRPRVRLAAEAGLELRRALVTGGAAADAADRARGRLHAAARRRRRARPGRPRRAGAAGPARSSTPRALADLASGGAAVERLPATVRCGRRSTRGGPGTPGWCAEPRAGHPAPGTRSTWSTASRSPRAWGRAASCSSTRPSTRAATSTGTRSTSSAGEAPALGARGELASTTLRVLPDAGALRRAGRLALVAGRGRAPSGSAISAARRRTWRASAVAGFGTTFGDDWFLVPCRLPTGSVVRAEPVKVRDCFGEQHVDPLVRRARRPRPGLAVLRAHRRSLGRRPEPGAAPLPMAAAGAGGRRA